MSTYTVRTAAGEVVEWRSRARRLVRGLIDASRGCDERLAAYGESDIMRAVRGRSSLDQAIVELRQLISDVDELLPPEEDQPTEAMRFR